MDSRLTMSGMTSQMEGFKMYTIGNDRSFVDGVGEGFLFSGLPLEINEASVTWHVCLEILTVWNRWLEEWLPILWQRRQ